MPAREPDQLTVPLLGSYGSDESRVTPVRSSRSQTLRVIMRPWVRVPVLSEQMLVTPPTASREGIWRTITWPLTMALVATAMVTVRTARRDSGITATPTHIPYSRTSSSICHLLTEKTMTARSMARPKSNRANLLRVTCRGVPSRPRMLRMLWWTLYSAFLAGVIPAVSFFFWRRSSAILPTSVSMPVEMTMPVARPRVTELPEKARLMRSPVGMSASSKTSSGFLLMATDSPVKCASSVERLMPLTSRRSAGTTSPVTSETKSPLTRVSALTVSLWPSRITLHFGVDRAYRDWMVCSARKS